VNLLTLYKYFVSTLVHFKRTDLVLVKLFIEIIHTAAQLAHLLTQLLELVVVDKHISQIYIKLVFASFLQLFTQKYIYTLLYNIEVEFLNYRQKFFALFKLADLLACYYILIRQIQKKLNEK
jgi:hypothetical protein